jgi:5S rRNA maturation endonuclease (ribonuclease M5)
MKIILIILTLFLTNCKLNKIVNHHGIHNLELKSAELIVNQTNINDIKRILGPPSSKSYFDNSMIIYLERKTSNSKLLKLGKRKLLANNVLLLEIDNKGMLIKKSFLDKDDLNRLKISQKVTDIETQKESFIKQALSNVLDRIDDPLGKKRGSIK